MKHYFIVSPFIAVLSMAFLAGCGQEKAEFEPVSIVYTNDIHSYIDNVAKDASGTSVDGLRLSKVAAYVNDKRSAGDNVLLVDAGDEIQGSVYGAFDQGKSVLSIMNACGYQLAVPGNHDFDYGMDRFLAARNEADYPFVSCNFYTIPEKKSVLDPYKIFEIGHRKIAFVGVCTPETITSSTPKFFQDENGNFIYGIAGTANPLDLYQTVQAAVDEAKGKADTVIVLGHVGVASDTIRNGISSCDIIKNTNGIDAFIDGHSHTVMEGEKVKNKDGKDVLLTQTGYYLNHFGEMQIDRSGAISTKLLTDYSREEASVAEKEAATIAVVNESLGEKIGTLESDLTVNNPEKENQRLIRAQEMNIGDFVADAFYWYFNENKGMDCDVAFQNGGGIRASMKAGELTRLIAKTVCPFGNVGCMVKATGQMILDALEMGATSTGDWDEAWDAPAENGGFLQVAGMKYTIDPNVKSSVQVDSNGMFLKVDGDYRVKDVEIYDKASKSYVALEKSKTYNVAGINYLLRNGGNGLSMFQKAELVVDYVGQDDMILSDYIQAFEKGDDGYAEVSTAHCPLAGYANYQLDYDDPYGAKRIAILEKA